MNPNCDGAGPHSSDATVKRLPTGCDGALILCKQCFYREIRYRRERMWQNPGVHYETPSWQELKAYEVGAESEKP